MLEKYIAKLEFNVDFCRGRHPRRPVCPRELLFAGRRGADPYGDDYTFKL